MRLPIVVAVIALLPLGTAAAFEWSHHASEPPPPASESVGVACFDREFDASDFLKGNLHTHTSRSDGDSRPEEVLGWYRQHGYAFVALTDHNLFTDPERWAWMQDGSFRVLAGEEVSMLGGGKQVHVNALCTKRRIGGGTFATPADALSWATARVDEQGGVALVNHPNFDRALTASDLLSATRAPLLEVMSGHPYVFPEGSAERPSAEALWDSALRDGVKFMGVAVDDMHHLRVTADPPASPGKGWVEVFARRNDGDAICRALRQGLLYASTGVSLSRIRVAAETYTIWPKTPHCEVSFLGRDGEVLWSGVTDGDRPASYALRGGEGYVRARIRAPGGALAWTPAAFVTETCGSNAASSTR